MLEQPKSNSAHVSGDNSVTVVCVYNDLHQFEQLKASLESQDVAFELIGIDNSGAEYKSAASAFNSHIDAIDTPWVIFSHQDIRFDSPGYLGRFVALMKEDPSALYGVAGPVSPAKRAPVLSSISDSKYVYDSLKGKTADVFVLDECFFGCAADVARSLRFDEAICDGWHFYAVDFCLRARLAGHSIRVLDGKGVRHLSAGTKNASFYDMERKLSARYAKEFRWIRTTCTWFPTGLLYGPFSFLRRLRHGGRIG